MTTKISEVRRAKLALAQEGITKAYERRDKAVVKAYEAGVSVMDITKALDLTPRAVYNILEKMGAR